MTSSKADQQQQLCRRFSLSDMQSATGDFSDAHVIGKGEFGKVYKGLIDNGSVTVAVKRLASNSNQGETEFAPRGSLHDILHGRQGIKGLDMEPCPALSWEQRLKIAVGIAEGLCYIHDKDLIHDDIVSNNVLLFNDDIAKLTNLGPPSQRPSPCNLPIGDEHPSSRSGNHPPEYRWRNQTQKGDVYRFGVLLLELLTGSNLLDCTRRVGQQNIVSWLGSDKVHKIVDARLKAAGYPPKAVDLMAEVAALCIQYDAEYRPDMSAVLRGLKYMFTEPQYNFQG